MMSCQDYMSTPSSDSEQEHNGGEQRLRHAGIHFYDCSDSEDTEYSCIRGRQAGHTEDVDDAESSAWKRFRPTEDTETHSTTCVVPDGEDENHFEDDLLYKLLEVSDKKTGPAYQELHNVFADDWDEAVTGWKNVVPYAKYSVMKKKAKKSYDSEKKSSGVRCISDDIDRPGSQSRCMWKSNVESVTYRYIPNNGQYRLHKFCKEERDWYTVRQKQAERVSSSLKMKYLQRELKRQLKSDFSKRTVHVEVDPEVDQSNSDEKNSSSSSPFLSLVKSASDLYSENIPSRLDALDKEIKRDSQIRKSHEDPNKVFPASASRGRCQQSKETPSPSHRAHSVHSSFIITPVSRLDNLRPLEKVTPQQRMKEDLLRSTHRQAKIATDGETSPGEMQAQSAIEVTNLDLERLRIMPLAESSQKYFGQIMKERHDTSGFLKTTKMPLSSGTGRSQNGHVMSTIGMAGSGNPTGVRGQRQSSQSQRSDNNLPGITGQRIEVPLSNFRLL